MARQPGQNGSPLQRGGAGGDISNVNSFSADDLCWRRQDLVLARAHVVGVELSFLIFKKEEK